MHIPVVDRQYASEHRPDCYFLLAWNYLPIIMEKEKDFLAAGGMFLLPTGDIITDSNRNHTGSNIITPNKPQKKILVAGGAGFIGSHFIRHLYTQYPEYVIHNLDLLTYCGNRDNLADLEAKDVELRPEGRRYVFVQVDICNKELIDRLLTQEHFDVVVNFADESHVDRSLSSAYDFIRTNVVGVHTLLDACRKHRIPRFVQISTDEVYGDIDQGFATEESSLNPSNPYAASKASADILIKSYMRSHALPAVIVRGSNNLGPYQYPEKLIPLAISNFLEGKKMPVHGDGRHVRSWLYVTDFCRAIDLVMREGNESEVYNVSGTQKTNLDVLERVHQILQLSQPIDAYKTHTNDRPGADRRYAPNSEKIQRVLGWKPDYDFDRAIATTVGWYMQNQSWWQEIKRQQGFLEHYKRQQEANYY